MENHALEEKRIAALRSYSILDIMPEAVFDPLAKLAAIAGEVPIAPITFVGEENGQNLRSASTSKQPIEVRPFAQIPSRQGQVNNRP